MRATIVNYIRAGYPGIFIVSHEEARVEAEMKAAAEGLKHGLQVWSSTEGLVGGNGLVAGSGGGVGRAAEAGWPAGALPDWRAVVVGDAPDGRDLSL